MSIGKTLTIGGATRDIYLRYKGADSMRIEGASGELSYMLFESGAKVEVEKVLYYTGGGATNSAASFKRLGFDVSCFCMVGDDPSGKQVLGDLEKEGVDFNKIIISKEHATGTSFVVNSLRGERTIFAYRGANSFLAAEHIPLDAIKSANQLYITSLSNESSKILGQIVKYAKKHKVSVAINPGVSQLSKGAQELKESLKYIDILILNSSEAKIFMGALVAKDKRYQKAFGCEETTKECVSDESIQEPYLLKTPLFHENLYFCVPSFFKEVMKMGPQIVVVTDGARGVYVAAENYVLFHPSLQVDVVDTLGAGDSFGSCFVACIRRGLKIEDALRRGIVNSASVIGKMGAKPGLLVFEELEKRVNELKKDILQRYEL